MEIKKIEFQIITLDWKKSDYTNAPSSSGLYQIYGTSPLYGLDTLLYIGQAKNLNHRLKRHFEFKQGVIGRQPNKTCRFATLNDSLLNAIEQTLIIMYKPSFNSSSLIQVSSDVKTRPVYIQNHGERGMLNIENTNFYFLNQISDKEIPFDVFLPTEIETL